MNYKFVLTSVASCVALACCWTVNLIAQTDVAASEALLSNSAPRLSEPNIFDVTLGLEVAATHGACSRLKCSFASPVEWPEQAIEIISQQQSPVVRSVKSAVLEGGVRQVQFLVPRLNRDETAVVSVRLRVTRRSISPPRNPASLKKPETIPTSMRRYLGASPFIETTNPLVIKAANEVSLPDEATAWQTVSAIREFTHNVITYSGVRALKGARAALEDQSGDCEERTSVFVALCRLHGIPARSVWIPMHAYAEFYLEGPDGAGYWFPCESVGGELGYIGNHFVILQKGDSFRDPQKPGRQRYITETAKGTATRGGAAPELKPIYELHAQASHTEQTPTRVGE